MLKSISTTFKDKLARSGLERVQTTTTTEVIDPKTTTITTTTVTESLSETTVEEDDSERGVSRLAVKSDDEKALAVIHDKEAQPLSESRGVRHGLKRILETITRKEDTTITTIQEQPGAITVDSQGSTSTVSFTASSIAVDSASPSSAVSYPGTINARFVKDQSNRQSMDGLRHALKASIEKSSATNQSGRLLLKTHRIQHLFSSSSIKQGKHFDAPESVAQIAHFIKTYKLDLSELLQPDLKQYKSFNEFFYRKLRPDARPVHGQHDPNIIVSSADCRLCVFESIKAATQVWIKGKSFSVEHLIQDKELAEQFEGGSIALFRLAPQDYHRFHSPVTGQIAKDPVKIDGTYLTVNPMAVNEDLDVFTENVRKVTVIELEQGSGLENAQFDQAVFVSIGALLVGSIVLTGAKEPGGRVLKGDELGYFAYGGSTCILLFKAGAVQFDEDLVATSQQGVETLVRMGERIGARA
ncbi:hypothetical protein BGZ75_009200 [Mortierella antarctica]|nr:hypothetical protein BGZ75_009200 [Mortierella antarctica]